MIGDKTLPEYLFQVIVMVQPMIWIILYNTPIYLKYRQEEILKWIIYIFMEATLFGIIILKPSIGFYTTSILAQYTILITVSFYMFTQRNQVKDAIALAFLTVFLNSFYWEIPLHILEIVKVGFYPGQLVQFWRLLPLGFFLPRFTFTKEHARLIILGPIFTILMVILYMAIKPVAAQIPYFFARFICMAILTKTIIDAEPKQSLNTN